MTDPAVDQTLRGTIALVVPEAALVAVACVLFLLSTLRAGRNLSALVAIGGLVLAFLLQFAVARPEGAVLTASPVVLDSLAVFMRNAALATGLVLVLLAWNEPGDRRAADYHACLLVITAGFSLTGLANDLIFLFLALELISIPTYVMLYLPSQSREAQEAAVKYFLLSILSSALLLFGFSYLYGVTGTTNLTALLRLLPRVSAGELSGLTLVAGVMVLAGLGFRITAFPFHLYAPDVYQGGPTGTVAMLAFVPKVAGFAALLRLFGSVGVEGAGPAFTGKMLILIWVLAAVTMTAGNVLALLQNNLKRLLAYSSVAHAGYLLIGLAILPVQELRPSGSEAVVNGAEAILFYLVAYGAMTVGVFAGLAYLSTPDRPVESIDDLAGLSESHPLVAGLMALFLFSLIGLPFTAGFVGKFLLFVGALATPAQAPMQQLYQVLALIAALNAAVGAYYYLRVIGVMFLRSAFRPFVPAGGYAALASVLICGAVTLVFGLYPWPILNASRIAAGVP